MFKSAIRWHDIMLKFEICRLALITRLCRLITQVLGHVLVIIINKIALKLIYLELSILRGNMVLFLYLRPLNKTLKYILAYVYNS